MFRLGYRGKEPGISGLLRALLPELTTFLDRQGLRGRCFFHLSDEPQSAHLQHYLELKEFLKPLLGEYPMMDALSDYAYYEQGVCEHPVVCTSEVEPFLEGARPKDFWVYYCCEQGVRQLSNRFFAMPGYRTRIFGFQCYVHEVAGFLQWGLNFYNSRWSLRHIDPFVVTDCDMSFPSGDAFVIYPGPEGEPIASGRLILFHEAIQDLAALKLLENLSSREHVLALIESYFDGPISFTSYPVGEEPILRLRNAVNREIEKYRDLG